jgi:hypothetical protein
LLRLLEVRDVQEQRLSALLAAPARQLAKLPGTAKADGGRAEEGPRQRSCAADHVGVPAGDYKQAGK